MPFEAPGARSVVEQPAAESGPVRISVASRAVLVMLL